MRLQEFAPSPDRDDNDDIPDQLLVLANRWWNATDRQPQIEHVLNSLGWSIQQVESEDDAVQLQHRDGTTYFISADDFDPDLFEISDELRRNYLNRAGKVVDRRMDHMARVQDRLNKGYEIYHADRPTTIVDRFDANTPAEARRYYEKFVHKYESDVDFDLRLRRSTGIMEIARIPQGDFGDADTLQSPKYDVEKKPLPGGAGFTYGIGQPKPEDLEIMIFDGDTLAAELDLFYTQDATDAWRVSTVAVNPAYRSQGLGKALYGIALSILRLTLEAGDTQTRHGQRMWLMLNRIPGVEVVGYSMERTGKYKARTGDEIIAQDNNWTKYTFPVRPGTHSMRSARYGTGMYTSMASMIARWTGK